MTINLTGPVFHKEDSVFHKEDKARSFFEGERWPNGTVCPFCDRGEHVKPLHGTSMGPAPHTLPWGVQVESANLN
jgi:hypothetical protein